MTIFRPNTFILTIEVYFINRVSIKNVIVIVISLGFCPVWGDFFTYLGTKAALNRPIIKASFSHV